MRVTLYKGCILSNSYNEVFDVTPRQETESGISIFEDYLATLEKRVFELDQVYVTNSGTLNFSLEIPNDYTDLYEFNYMKVEYESIVRYCFIDDIKLGNELGIISYSEDIWHSYASSMKIRNSLLTSSRKLKYGDKDIKLFSLPFNYDSNNELIIQRDYRNKNYILLGKLQFYKTDSSGKTTNRNSEICLISVKKTPGNIAEVSTVSKENLIKWMDVINISASELLIAYRDGLRQNWYYDITEFYILEEKYLPFLSTEWRANGYYTEILNDEEDITKYAFTFYDINIQNPNYFEITNIDENGFSFERQNQENIQLIDGSLLVEKIKIKNNFKITSVGFISHQLEVTNNGNDIELSLYFYKDNYDFKILISYQQKMEDITQALSVDLPYTYINASENAQRNLARRVTTMTNSIKIIGSLIMGAYGMKNGIGINGKIIRTGTTTYGDELTKYNYRHTKDVISNRNLSSKVTSKGDTHYSSSSEKMPGMIDTGNNIFDSCFAIAEANAPVYSSNYGSFIESDGILNALNGFCVLKIKPDNEIQLQNVVNNVGYNVYEIVNDILIYNQNDYNVIKFNFVNINGKFSQLIVNKLKEILLNGVKIWYTKEVG